MMNCSEEVDERYKNGKIYQIVCNITGEVYIGSTKAYLTERMSKHLKENNMYDCVSKRIIDRGDYTLSLIENYPCRNKSELRWRERYHTETMKCININRPIITEEERKQLKHDSYERNKERTKPIHRERQKLPENRAKQKARRDNPENKKRQAAWDKQYRLDNVEKIKINKAKYQQDNKEAISAQRKEYRENNAEAIKLKKAAEYQKLKAQGFITITCGCGGTHNNRGGSKTRHEATKKHLKWVANSLA
mgnify:FL=1